MLGPLTYTGSQVRSTDDNLYLELVLEMGTGGSLVGLNP